MLECVAGVATRIAAVSILADHPRAMEWLEEVRPYLALAVREGETGAEQALAALVAWQDLFAVVPNEASGRGAERGSNTLPVSGQITSYRARSGAGSSELRAVPDDGAIRAGVARRFVDNGDGTVSDRTTGLMWEKKCDACGGLHDAGYGYLWSGTADDTVWDWIEAVNHEGGEGFAGYDDWRVPNVRELFSLLDFERFNPAVAPAFDGALCGLGCDDMNTAECSCTGMSYYWTSTTFGDFPAHAVVVGFHLPLVGDRSKTTRLYARAVRDAGSTEPASSSTGTQERD